MANKKDTTPSDGKEKSELSIDNSKKKPFLDEETDAATADIDTSHLTLEDSTDKSGLSLESEDGVENADIDTSSLSLEEAPKKTPSDDSSEPPSIDSTSADAPSAESPQVDASAKKSAPEQNGDSASEPPPLPSIRKGPSGEVVLSSGIPDANFNDSDNAGGKAKEPASPNERENAQDNESDSAIKSLLDTVQKPEKIVQNAWSNSSVRRYLLDNIESFRVKDEDQNMESVIENVYGGVVEKKIAPGKFLKDNLLFSFLLFLFLFLVSWKSAEIFFPELMPALNDQIIDTVKKTTGGEKTTETEDERKPVVTNFENKEKIDQVLSHCLVEPNARIAFAQAFIPVGYEFTDRTITISYDEIEASIDAWKNMDMEFYINDAIYRFDVLSKLSLPVTEKVRSTVANYKKSLLDITAQADELKKSIRNIKTRGGNQSTNTVNERIPLLNKLEKINTRLSLEPGIARFDQLLEKIESVENILSGKTRPTRIESEELAQKEFAWLIATAEKKSGEINLPISEKVLPAITAPSVELKQITPKLTAFQLTELESALNDLAKLSALLVYFPEEMLAPFKLELSSLNRRLNSTMEKELSSWIGIDKCLANTRNKVSAQIE